MRFLLLIGRLVLPVRPSSHRVHCWPHYPQIKWPTLTSAGGQDLWTSCHIQYHPTSPCFLICRSFITSPTLFCQKEGKVSKAQPRNSPGSKKQVDQKVYLIGEDGEALGVMPLTEAQEMSTSSNRKLVEIDIVPDNLHDVDEAVGNHKLYRLMTGKQFSEEKKRLQALKKTSKRKTTKIIRLSSKIAKHDLARKMKHILELLHKGHNISIFLQDNKGSSSGKKLAELFGDISEAVADVATVKQVKRVVRGLQGNWVEDDDHATEMEIRLAPRHAESDSHQTEAIQPMSQRQLKQQEKTKDNDH